MQNPKSFGNNTRSGFLAVVILMTDAILLIS